MEQDLLSPLPTSDLVQRTIYRATRRLRAANVRRFWNQSKMLASTISDIQLDTMQTAWFFDRFGLEEDAEPGETEKEIARTKAQKETNQRFQKGQKNTRYQNIYIRNILWLIEVREGFQQRHDNHSIMRVNAAIWRNVTTLKAYRAIYKYKQAALGAKEQTLLTSKTDSKLKDRHYNAPYNHTSQLVATATPQHQTGCIYQHNRSTSSNHIIS
jgi:hypothetical protein